MVKRCKSDCISQFVTRKLAQFFNTYTLFTYDRPCIIVLCGILLILICSAGLLAMRSESDVEALWIPRDSAIWHNRELYQSYFGEFTRYNYILFTVNDDDNTDDIEDNNKKDNLLTIDHLTEITNIWNDILYLHVTINSKTYYFNDLCEKLYNSPNAPCKSIYSSFLQLWNFDVNTLEANFASSENAIYQAFYGFYFYYLKDLLSIYLANMNIDDTRMEINSTNAMLLIFEESNAFEEISIEWEQKFIDYCDELQQEKNTNNRKLNFTQIYYATQRSQDDELTRTVVATLPNIALSFIIISFLFVIMLHASSESSSNLMANYNNEKTKEKGGFCYFLKQMFCYCECDKFKLSFILLPLIFGSIFGAIGIGSLFGATFNSLTLLLAFLMIGVGMYMYML